VKYQSFDAYCAVHKALSDAMGAAEKKYDEAQAGLAKSTERNDAADLHDAYKREFEKAQLTRDDLQKELAGHVKDNPGLEQERKDQQALEAEQKQGIGGSLREMAAESPLIVKTGQVVVNIVKTVLGQPPDYIDPHPLPPMDVGQMVEHAKFLLTGGPGELVANQTGNPIHDPMSVNDVMEKTPVLKQYERDFGAALAEGVGPREAGEIAGAKLFKNLTGEDYAKPDGLREAISKELQQRLGEPARVAYEAFTPTPEQEMNRIAQLAGHTH
jgi:hypothetical protein